MDQSDPDIVFDDLGVCNHCNEAVTLLPKYMNLEPQNNEIEELIAKVKSQKGDYNCLIGLSGGIDSSYVALLAKNGT